MRTKLMTIKFIMEKYNLSRYMIYHTIKHDPSFPVRNIGPRKNYRIDLSLFEEWLCRRAATTSYGDEVPTSKELLGLSYGH